MGIPAQADSIGAVLGAYVPQDRREHLVGAVTVAGRAHGSMLFADVSGFTTLTSKLTQMLGRRRGAEEVPRYLNRLYDALILEVERRAGSVIGFAGDAITCWFAGDDGELAVGCATAMQRAMEAFRAIRLGADPAEEPVALSVKVSVTNGWVRRFVVGDPAIQLLDVVAGDTVSRLEPLNELATSGQVVIDPATAKALRGRVSLLSREDAQGCPAFVVEGTPEIGRAVRNDEVATAQATAEQLGPWLLPTVQRRLREGQGEFLTELRPVAALFMAFDGIDYDEDEHAPQKLDELVGWVQHEAAAVGGNIVQLTVGDKGSYLYLACGAPISNGDDVHRCAAAAVNLRRAAERFEFIDSVKIGLGYGTARTGAYGSSRRRTYGALGIETNLAARLMGVAASGTAMASDAFARACQDSFTFKAHAPRQFKGSLEPVKVHELQAHVSGGVQLSSDDRGQQRTVGREQEIAVVSEALMNARLGRGMVVQLTAPAGMGKSRVIAAALAATDRDDLALYTGQAQSYARTAPFRIWDSVIHGVLELDPRSPANERGAALAAAVDALDPSLTPRLPLLAPVLDIHLEDNFLVASMNPELRQASRIDLLTSLLRKRAERLAAAGKTMVIVLEDLHAIDPLSRDLLESFARLVPDLPLALITAGRPEQLGAEALQRTSPGAPLFLMGATQLLLGPLKPHEAEQLIAERMRGTTFATDEALLDKLLSRAEGNPFYLEVLLAEIAARGGDTSSTGDGELPTNLHSLILARLDHLSEHQQANLKVASVVGREFQARWVHSVVARRSPQEVVDDLEVTRRLELTPLANRTPLTYRFDHTITRDVTYESLPHELQLELHTRLARFIEGSVATPDDPHLDLLAFHYERSRDLEKRQQYLWRAGRAAQDNYAHEAAVDYYLRLLPTLTGAARLEPQLALGEVTTFMGDYESAEAHLRAALATAQEGADGHGLAKAQRLLGELFERRGDHTTARVWLEKAVRSCRELDARSELTQVLLALGGNALWHLGLYPEANQLLLEAFELAQEDGDTRAKARALHGLANIHLYRGEAASAEERYAESLRLRREAGDELGVANSLNNLGIVAANAGRKHDAEDLFRQSLAIRRRLGDVSGVAVALNNLGFMAAEDGKLDEAKRMFEQSLALRREIGDELGNAVCLNNLADVARRQGELAEARRLYHESLDLSHRIGNRREAATALVGLAATAEADQTALRLATFAESLMASLGASLDREVKTTLDEVLTTTSLHLGDDAVKAARTTAERLPFEQMASQALADTVAGIGG